MLTTDLSHQQQPKKILAVHNPALGWINNCRIIRHILFSLALFLLAFSPMAARANSTIEDAAGPWIGDPAIGEARLISAVNSTGDLRELPLGLEFRLAPGWKIYWRTPGEAGLPPTLNLQLANGEAIAHKINWPVPKRFDAFGFDNFGYTNSVILPVTVTGYPKGANVQIVGQMEALACADICVPLAGEIGLTIADGPLTASSFAVEIARYKAKVPRSSSSSTIHVETVWQDGATLNVQVGASGPVIDEIFVEGAAGIAFKKPVYDNGVARIALEGKLNTPLTGQMLNLTIIAGDDFVSGQHVVEQVGPVSEDLSGSTTRVPFDSGSTWFIVAFAFLGGLILNLMPCVLPVLAIKLAAIIDSSGQSRDLVRMRFAAGASGILASFGIGAAGLAALKFVGGQVGWGIQFQSPLFLAVMMLVLGLFTLNILERFFLPIPSLIATAVSAGSNETASYDRWKLLASDFMAGMLATLLATPCSAPFVGSAVTVALTGDMLRLFCVFMAMGTGLATPWVMVALFPALIEFLPKPGPWMDWLKRGLAGLLILTMFWIGWLLEATQGGIAAMAIIGLVGLVLVTVLWRRKFAILLASASFIFGLLALPPPTKVKILPSKELMWEVWSETAQKVAQDDGKLVFIDVTADWCVTCKANKSFVLEKAPVAMMLAELVDEGRLIMLQANWTRPDPSILAFLANHQRFGIPFNIIYGPAAPNGVILGELLNAGMVERALVDAGMTR